MDQDRGAAGFEILAAWGYDQKEQPSYVLRAATRSTGWTAAEPCRCGPTFGAPRSMNARVPADSLVEANESRASTG